jgi:hypothetical protein
MCAASLALARPVRAPASMQLVTAWQSRYVNIAAEALTKAVKTVIG